MKIKSHPVGVITLVRVGRYEVVPRFFLALLTLESAVWWFEYSVVSYVFCLWSRFCNKCIHRDVGSLALLIFRSGFLPIFSPVVPNIRFGLPKGSIFSVGFEAFNALSALLSMQDYRF